MEYRRLGTSGLLVSALGLGTNNLGSRLDESGSRAVVEAALDVGVTFFDTADVYGRGASESALGAALALGGRMSSWRPRPAARSVTGHGNGAPPGAG
jgi:aryl-alcohol dehydrogenase-like predicted oxidoreductase